MSASTKRSVELFNYELPERLIAQYPSDQRTDSRLLVLDAQGHYSDHVFTDLHQFVQAGDVLVFNNTQVIKARLWGHKQTGGKVEILVERLLDNNRVLAHIKASKAPKAGSTLVVADQALHLKVLARHDALFELQFDQDVHTALEHYGQLPLPPYITHTPSATDEERYQTIYARHPGAVAAPTAGLHFDQQVLDQLQRQGVHTAFVTLHVGAGTFQPVRATHIEDHQMHAERYTVPAASLALIQQAKANGKRIIAVGTTSVRALESAAQQLAQQPSTTGDLSGDTRIFITPGYTFNYVDALITNFHLPQSTLLMLVSALAGLEPIQAAYAHAVQNNYRFFSYGDAMFIEKANHERI